MIKYTLLFALILTVFSSFSQAIDTTLQLQDMQDSASFFGSDESLISKEELNQKKLYLSIEAALKEPKEVYKLSLKGKNLKLFPFQVFELPNLQYLDLSDNKISEIPIDIEKLKKIQYLNLAQNQLMQLPPEIGMLNNLEEFDLKYNQLLNLPKEIGSMISLQKLDLSHNRLVALPNQILGLESLISLYVKENNFSAAERERIRKMRRQWLTIYLN